MKKPDLNCCESFVLENGNGTPKKIVLIPVALFLEQGNGLPQAVSGADLAQSQSYGEYSLASREDAKAFCATRSQVLRDWQVVFPLADASVEAGLLVRLPRYMRARIGEVGNPHESVCLPAPLHFVFTKASWVAFIKNE